MRPEIIILADKHPPCLKLPNNKPAGKSTAS
jgi:hypothetical protein